MSDTPTAPAPGALPPSPFKGLSKGFDSALARGIGHVTRRTLGPHQTAIVRIGFAVTMLTFLLREWPHRGELYGPDSPWGFDLAARFTANNQAFSLLLWNDSHLWFELVYHLTILASVAMLVGWRTRLSSLLFMIGVLSLQNRSIFMGDGGDNVIHLMAMYLTLTRCARVWSLDARRAARTPRDATDPAGIALWALSGAALLAALLSGELDSPIWSMFFCGMWAAHAVWWLLRRHAPGEPRIVADMIANLVHNAALLVIMCEVCLIYATAGWYKIQGSRWQDGTAVYYPMNLDYFTPWPWLTDFLAANGYLVLAMSYGTVFVQVGFVFALLNRRAKNILLFVMVGEHLGIAVLMGLPFFSLAMIAMDAVFLPTAFLLWGGSRLRLGAERLLPASVRHRFAAPPPAPAAAASLPGQRATERETAAHR
ncbi:HTTM domain-containing protein [Streptomyces avicenniae]|uniref:HTTM domain-containing protein n=1 Tax=Streptomyces avicenniae TaxID=500153 RepID=UPI00069AD411|nr:HTTM domain-containing protein [Streptomyces avicenniae]